MREKHWRVVVVALVLLAFVPAGCGVTIRAEGCYYEPEYGRVCVVATRDPDGKITVELKADVNGLPAPVLGRAAEFGASLVRNKDAPAE